MLDLEVSSLEVSSGMLREKTAADQFHTAARCHTSVEKGGASSVGSSGAGVSEISLNCFPFLNSPHHTLPDAK